MVYTAPCLKLPALYLGVATAGGCQRLLTHYRQREVRNSIQCKPDISRLCISRNWIYHCRMLDPIFLPTDFANFADVAPKSAIFFREIAVTPCIQFAGDNFSRNLLTAIAFVPVRWRQFFAKSTRAYLSMRAGTHAVRWAATLGGALTPPLCRRVGSS